MAALLFFIVWFSGILIFLLFEAIIGVGIDLDSEEYPGAIFTAVFWPITIPLIIMYHFMSLVSFLKRRRISRLNIKLKKKRAKDLEERKIAALVDKELKELDSILENSYTNKRVDISKNDSLKEYIESCYNKPTVNYTFNSKK